jgi:hypothetical protein
MKKVALVLISFLIASSMSCSAIYDVSYDYDRNAEVLELRTYDWLPVPGGAEMDSLLENRIKNSVDNQLESKGLRRTSDHPDFLIAMHAGTEEKVRYTDWGYHYGPYWRGPSYSKFKYQEGTLILDFVDSRSKQLIWRGVARGFVDSDMTPEKTDKLVNEAVQKILENFPPPSSK